MKKIIIALASLLVLAGCGVGTYSVSSGMSDEAAISITAPVKENVIAVIDGKEYNVETVKVKAYKQADVKIKKTALNAVTVQPGQHEVKILVGGNEVYNKKLLISSSEHRIINL